MMPTEKMRALAKRPRGVGTDEMPGMGRREAASVASRLCRGGELHRAVVRGAGGVRYFADPADRDAWVAANRVSGKAKNAARRFVEGSIPARSISGKGPAHLPGEPVITAATKVTVCPGMPQPTRTNTHSVAV